MPADRTRRPLPSGVTTNGIETLREHSQRRQIAVIVVVVTEQAPSRWAAGRQTARLAGALAVAPVQVSGLARSEYIGSVRMFPAAV